MSTAAAKQELYGLLDTALRVRNEGLEGQFQMDEWVKYDPECGTVACLAGWHAVFRHSSRGTTHQMMRAIDLDYEISRAVSAALPFGKHGMVSHILFGGGRGICLTNAQALDRQIKAIRWFIHRVEALENYERLRAMPKKERRRLRLAA